MADIYFDFSASNNGDGTTAAQATGAGLTGAYNTTDGVAPGIGDIWWVRRSGAQPTIATTITPVHSFAICGWPKSGDENYTGRPASGTAEGWDTDLQDYGEIYRTNNIVAYAVTTVAINGFYTSRMSYNNNSSAGGFNIIGLMRGMTVINCEFVNSSSSANYPTASIAGHNTHVRDCVFRGTVAGMRADFTNMNNGIVENCTMSFGLNVTSCTNCTFSNIDIILTVNNVHYTGIVTDKADNCRFENITIDNSTYSGVTKYGLISSASTSDVNKTMDIKVKGDYSLVNIDGDYSNISLTPLVSGDTINCTSITVLGTNKYVVLENFVGDTASFNSAENLVVFMNGCSVPDNNYTITQLGNGAVYSLHHGGVQGFWKAFGNNGIIESTIVNRTGGSSHSLRCELQSINNNVEDVFPCLGVRGVGETIFLDLVAGTHTITMYGAHKIFANALTKGELYMETEYLDTNGFQKFVTSVQAGTLTSDASVWNGDTGLTVFSFGLTVTLPTDQRIPVRILGNYEHETNAYLYIDPTPVVS